MKIIILGSGQDAGVPQIGCYCDNCRRARKNKRFRRYAASVAVFDERQGYCYVIDASPDIKLQIDLLRKKIQKVKRCGKIPVSGILLTHAHFGHYAGLLHLGKESVNENKLPVFCTSTMKEFITCSAPLNFLLKQKNIELHTIRKGSGFKLSNAAFRSFDVPHRNEFTDTVGITVRGRKQLIYIPDLDRWTGNIIQLIRNSDIALLDGTFYSRTELSRYSQVPHPPIEHTIGLLRGCKTKVYFTHINHTNPVNSSKKHIKLLVDNGFGIAHDGLILDL